MDNASIPPKPKASLAGPILFAGIVLAASLYAFGGLSKFFGADKGASSCVARAPAARKLKPFATGAVAAVQVLDKPTPASDLHFTNSAGENVTLASFRGRVVLLNLWATWCVPCRLEMPALDKLNAEMGDDGRFQVVAVNIDTRNFEKPKEFFKEAKIASLAYFSDPSAKVFQDLKAAGRAFGMPTSVLIDAQGCELAWLAGPAEWGGAEAQALVRSAIEK